VLPRAARGLRAAGAHPRAGDWVFGPPPGGGPPLAAGFHVGGPELGVATAARCCTQIGAMP
jgi:hypothetical protein